MKRMTHPLRVSVVLFVSAIIGIGADARPQRDHKAVAAFQRANPCPSTGAHRGACPGHQVDHVTPLCAGGFDRPDNMQWLPVDEHQRKTRADLLVCSRLRELDRRQ